MNFKELEEDGFDDYDPIKDQIVLDDHNATNTIDPDNLPDRDSEIVDLDSLPEEIRFKELYRMYLAFTEFLKENSLATVEPSFLQFSKLFY